MRWRCLANGAQHDPQPDGGIDRGSVVLEGLPMLALRLALL